MRKKPIHKTVRFVDGFAIRSRLDPDFGIIGEHGLTGFAPKYYIPRGETWFDKRFRKEKEFLLKVEDFERREMRKHVKYQHVRAAIQKKFCTRGPRQDCVIRRQRRGGLTVCLVDGSVVRRSIDPSFIFGGHSRVYPYIPKGEIWLDILQDPREIPYHLLHELTEYRLMGSGMPYDSAHDLATATDKAARRKNGIGRYPGDPSYRPHHRIPHAQT